MIKPIVISGLMGSGKSFLARKIFSRKGDYWKRFSLKNRVWVIEVDELGHWCLEKKTVQKKIYRVFGKKMFFKNGEINRKYIKKQILFFPKKWDVLENIIHPEIKKEILKIINSRLIPFKEGDFFLRTGVFNQTIIFSCALDKQFFSDIPHKKIILKTQKYPFLWRLKKTRKMSYKEIYRFWDRQVLIKA